MKINKNCFLIFMLLLQFEAGAQENDLNNFLERFNIYVTAHKPKVKWTMPVITPESSATSMPNAIRGGESFMTDPGTGLRIYPHEGKMYDPKTGYYIAFDPEKEYFVDLEKRKIFTGKAEVKIERQNRF